MRSDEKSRRLGDKLRGVVEVGRENVDNVAQTCGGVSYTVRYMYPALGCLYRNSARAVLDLGYGVVAVELITAMLKCATAFVGLVGAVYAVLNMAFNYNNLTHDNRSSKVGR